MFYAFALFLTLNTGQVRPLIDDGHPYSTYANCIETLNARLIKFEEIASEERAGVVLAMGCLKKKPGPLPGQQDN